MVFRRVIAREPWLGIWSSGSEGLRSWGLGPFGSSVHWVYSDIPDFCEVQGAEGLEIQFPQLHTAAYRVGLEPTLASGFLKYARM